MGAGSEVLFASKFRRQPQSKEVKLIYKMFDMYDINPDLKSMLRTYDGIALSGEEQSILSKEMFDVGRLDERLYEFFTDNDKFARLATEFDVYVSDQGNRNKGTRSDEARQAIAREVLSIYRKAKQVAIENGSLQEKKSFIEKQIKAQEDLDLVSQQPQLPDDIQNILAINK